MVNFLLASFGIGRPIRLHRVLRLDCVSEFFSELNKLCKFLCCIDQQFGHSTETLIYYISKSESSSDATKWISQCICVPWARHSYDEDFRKYMFVMLNIMYA